MSEIRILEQVASIKLLCADLERHLKAGAIQKANFDAVEIEAAAQHLFNMTYEHAFPSLKKESYDRISLAELKLAIFKDSAWEGFSDSIAWHAIRGASSVQQIVTHMIGAQMVNSIEAGKKFLNGLADKELADKESERQSNQSDAAEHGQHVE